MHYISEGSEQYYMLRTCTRTDAAAREVLTDQGHIWSWGNNVDGQAGQGQRCPAHKLILLDPRIPRSALQVRGTTVLRGDGPTKQHSERP